MFSLTNGGLIGIFKISVWLMCTAWATAHASSILEVEPNGSATQAQVINWSTKGSIQIQGSISPATDLDVFKLNGVPAGARIWVGTDTGGVRTDLANTGDTVIEVLASDGLTVIEYDDDDGTGNGADGTKETYVASLISGRTLIIGGDYFVRVSGYEKTDVIDPYILTVVVTNPNSLPELIESEPNDIIALANSILTAAVPVNVYNGSISGIADQDMYAVEAQAGDMIFLAADGDPERDGMGTDLALEIRDASNVTLLRFNNSINGRLGNPTAEGGRYLIQKAGTYYVSVLLGGTIAGTSGTYSLMVARASPPPKGVVNSVPIFASGPMLLLVGLLGATFSRRCFR